MNTIIIDFTLAFLCTIAACAFLTAVYYFTKASMRLHDAIFSREEYMAANDNPRGLYISDEDLTALDDIYGQGMERLNQIEIQANATGNAAGPAFSDVRNALVLLRRKVHEIPVENAAEEETVTTEDVRNLSDLADNIQGAVLEHLKKEQRPGGLLNSGLKYPDSVDEIDDQVQDNIRRANKSEAEHKKDFQPGGRDSQFAQPDEYNKIKVTDGNHDPRTLEKFVDDKKLPVPVQALMRNVQPLKTQLQDIPHDVIFHYIDKGYNSAVLLLHKSGILITEERMQEIEKLEEFWEENSTEKTDDFLPEENINSGQENQDIKSYEEFVTDKVELELTEEIPTAKDSIIVWKDGRPSMYASLETEDFVKEDGAGNILPSYYVNNGNYYITIAEDRITVYAETGKAMGTETYDKITPAPIVTHGAEIEYDIPKLWKHYDRVLFLAEKLQNKILPLDFKRDIL